MFVNPLSVLLLFNSDKVPWRAVNNYYYLRQGSSVFTSVRLLVGLSAGLHENYWTKLAWRMGLFNMRRYGVFNILVNLSGDKRRSWFKKKIRSMLVTGICEWEHFDADQHKNLDPAVVSSILNLHYELISWLFFVQFICQWNVKMVKMHMRFTVFKYVFSQGL